MVNFGSKMVKNGYFGGKSGSVSGEDPAEILTIAVKSGQKCLKVAKNDVFWG